MSFSRKCTLVVDFSVLPSRPDPSAAEEFIFQKVKLEPTDALAIQFHNIHRRFYIQMASNEKPLMYERDHNYKHVMLSEGREYKIPVYFEDGATVVRIHDLPYSLPNAIVREHMGQYGKVVSMANERWKNYFGGLFNGVRIFRMHLKKPISSYLNIAGYETLCTHSGGQIKTCRFCHAPLHPNTKCGLGQQTTTTSQQTTPASLSPNEFPELTSSNRITSLTTEAPLQQTDQPTTSSKTKSTRLPSVQHKIHKQATKQQNTPQEQEQFDEDDENNGHSEAVNSKRRLSTDKGNNTKKPCQLNSPTGVDTQNCFVLLSPMDDSTEKNVVPKN